MSQPKKQAVTTKILAIVITLALCSKPAPASPSPNDLAPLKRQVIATYAEIASATYSDSLQTARALQSAVDALLASPSEQTLAAARKAWLAARSPYSQSEVFRFYDGPIDQIETKVNSWPIDENYIDYVASDPHAGIINNSSNFPALSRDLLISLNEKEGKKNISTGYHALEFLLWGQGAGDTDPGNRPWTDYTPGSESANRRRQYLQIIASLLVEHLQGVADAWAPNKASNYRHDFLSGDPDSALANILKGMGSLSGPELSGERLTVPYETKEKKEEQDCFSDNTHNDLIDDALGIQNIYFGRYRDISGHELHGPGLRDLLARQDADLAEKLGAQINSSVTNTRSIPEAFGKAIQGKDNAPGRIAVKKAMASFQTQSDLIAQAAKALSIQLNL